MKPQELELTAANGDNIRGLHQEPFNLSANLLEPVIMIFCHGFPESRMDAYDGLFAKLQNVCSQLGIHSVRFDFRGCGASDGAAEDFTIDTAIEDLQTITNWAEEQNYPRIMMTCEGLGTIPALMSIGERAEAAAFFWPVFSPQDYAARNLQAEEHRQNFEKGGYIETGRGKIGIPLIKQLYEMDLVPIMNLVKFPCLIQQGAEDDKIPIEFLDMACAHFRNRRIEITTYQDGTHGLPQENHRKNLMYHYEQFIQKYI